ncbi:damage-control phosphatase ARMT1 [Drosophila albomicans]|uniref:Sugar phosphate phosphatase n=1 Tax=Drosophila albomicans TaxID=7291 RepID=A0A6P8WY46_DROAB|nr:damage-control phosphatase ARMT1 [Drosophila albomicans]
MNERFVLLPLLLHLLLCQQTTSAELNITEPRSHQGILRNMSLTQDDADFDVKNGIIDSETPPHTLLAALYKQSFAYYTFRVRLPSTLETIANSLAKDKDELLTVHGADVTSDIEQTVNEIRELRLNILQNGNLLAFTDNGSDTAVWNAFLEQLPQQQRTYFRACWLYAECYMYRKVSSIFLTSKYLASYDYFSKQKQTAAQLSLDAMLAVARGTRSSESNAATFQQLLKLNLWGNRCDLSITSGKQIKPTGDALDLVKELDDNLLVDNTNAIWQSLHSANGEGIVEIICDNAGYELYTDLILAEYIIDKGLAKKVRFNVKAIPWFISDVMSHDYHWTLQFLADQADPLLSELGKKLKRLTDEGKFELAPLEHFWTSPYEFYRMAEVNAPLYERLSQAQLVIFKGDLNYRKLLGDYSWNDTESFDTCLRGFKPSNLCTLRTIKADLVCGLPQGLSQQLFAKNKEWMLTGEYGLIQFASK